MRQNRTVQIGLYSINLINMYFKFAFNDILFNADRLIAWGDYENLYGPWGGGGLKKEPLKKKSSVPPCSIHNECGLISKAYLVFAKGFCP